ncbi:MAG: hypothetical protein HQM04_06680 [Magnetococcales bacterium]|nr:hypothetical protein [Magnetococcales bacterium]MBF0114712.1 hypothetical protein [Magnetococcales bacterium]
MNALREIVEVLEVARHQLATQHNLLVTDLPQGDIPETHWRIDNSAILDRLDNMLEDLTKSSDTSSCSLCGKQNISHEKARS